MISLYPIKFVREFNGDISKRPKLSLYPIITTLREQKYSYPIKYIVSFSSIIDLTIGQVPKLRSLLVNY